MDLYIFWFASIIFWISWSIPWTHLYKLRRTRVRAVVALVVAVAVAAVVVVVVAPGGGDGRHYCQHHRSHRHRHAFVELCLDLFVLAAYPEHCFLNF